MFFLIIFLIILKMKECFFFGFVLVFICCNGLNNNDLIQSQKNVMKIINKSYNKFSKEKDFEIQIFISLEENFNLLNEEEINTILIFYNYYLQQYSLIQNMKKEKFNIILKSVKKVVYLIIKNYFFISNNYKLRITKLLENISKNIVNREENIKNDVNDSFEIYLINQDIKKKKITSNKKNVTLIFDNKTFRENKIANIVFFIFSDLTHEKNLYASVLVKSYLFDFEDKIIQNTKLKNNLFEIDFNLDSSRDYSSCCEIDTFNFSIIKRKSIQNLNNQKGIINIKCLNIDFSFNFLTVQIKQIRNNKKLNIFMIILIPIIILFPLKKKIKKKQNILKKHKIK